MRIYRVSGMTCGGCEKAVEADAGRGEVRVPGSADPQIVSFAIEGAGYAVDGVSG